MKLVMMALFTTLIFASCSSDDDQGILENNVVGSWTLIEANAQFPTDINNDGTADPNIMNEIPCFEGNVTFSASSEFSRTFSILKVEEINGATVIGCDGSERIDGTYAIMGNDIVFTTNGPELETNTFPFGLDGNILKIMMPLGDLGTIEMVAQRN